MKILNLKSEKNIFKVATMAIGLAFITVTLSLLFMAQSSFVDQIELSEERITREAAIHTTALESFLNHSREELIDISASPVLLAFFHNRDLGMSMQYGLRASLSNIKEMFKHEIQRKKFKGSNIYSCFTLLDTDGLPLVSYSTPGEKQKGQRTKKELAYLKKNIQFKLGKTGCHAVLCLPFKYKGKLSGYLIAKIPMETIKKVFQGKEIFDDSELYIGDSLKKIVPIKNTSKRQADELSQMIKKRESYTEKIKTTKLKKEFLICKNRIKDTHLFLLYMIPTEDFIGKATKSRNIFLIMWIMSFLTVFLFSKIIIDKTKKLNLTKISLEKSIQTMKKNGIKLNKLNKTLLQIPLSIVIINIDGVIEYNSMHKLRLPGLKDKVIIGYHLKDLIDEDIFNFKEIKQIVLEEGMWKKELKNTNKKEEPSWEYISITVSSVKDDKKDITHFLAILEDITQRKEMERQFSHGQKLESIGQLAAGIAHEINTPIQFIGDNLHFLEDSFNDLLGFMKVNTAPDENKSDEECDLEYLTTEIPVAIKESMDGVERVSKIVRAMKEFSHPGTEEQKNIDINKVIENTVTVAKNEWKYVSNLTMDLDSTLPLVPCKSGELGQVILNMIVNAAQSIEEKLGKSPAEKGYIKISTKVINAFAEIRLEDTGMGIPQKIQDRIFDPFFTTKEIGKGTGQGLNISYMLIVKKLNGSISFETEPEQGTTFIIKLPLS